MKRLEIGVRELEIQLNFIQINMGLQLFLGSSSMTDNVKSSILNSFLGV